MYTTSKFTAGRCEIRPGGNDRLICHRPGAGFQSSDRSIEVLRQWLKPFSDGGEDAMRSVRLSQDVQLQRANKSSPLLSRGATGTGVAILQDLLADLGSKFVKTFSHGRADGIFGPETESAVKQFQTRSGLRADGIVGPRTLAALDTAIIQDDRLERRRSPHRGEAGYW